MTTRAWSFVGRLAALDLPRTFNPYRDRCAAFDVAEGAQVRQQNLALALEAALSQKIDAIWIARDLGYRGGRRTGLALTDEYHLDDHARLLGCNPFSRATRGEAAPERTAKVIWASLNRVSRPTFLWNVFPLHPHHEHNPHSNRCHTRAEAEVARPFLQDLLDLMEPRNVIAIGRDAQSALARMNIKAIGVRHPSYGGEQEFREGIARYYGLGPE